MKNLAYFGAAAIAAFTVGTAASAQVGLGAGPATDAAELNEDLIEDIEDDAERDIGRFGNEGRPQGFTGSLALRATAASGNTDNYNLGIGTDLGYVAGPNGFELQLNYSYGEEDGVRTDESLFYTAEYTRDFTPRFFGYAKLQGSIDDFSSYQSDTFLTVGAGYRIYNTPTMQWSVQAGAGYRYAEFNDFTDSLTDLDFSEPAVALSSDYAHRLTETVYVTNDTDVLWSDSDTVVFNDLALSVAMTDTLALRTSVLTEYHSDPLPGFEDTDNTYGVSVVYNFN
ncbi:DUF481 domain-containing protein [Wenxinia marina]|uniref:Salt-induced outer membrane protein n=1 Tax=Wenxinia marina DSM 24838 TaxID=1123501 RepID=A0A0D0Q671_9RHOB|nr:DUF481 domain-containing protein [Wenxinia marina]KIQ67962.1 Putative salt-induced outer membrane protein [Wenxinia marina DSM 24838]GGL75885.1 salt-stress induced outer membrane protein [Wenxinia marina]